MRREALGYSALVKNNFPSSQFFNGTWEKTDQGLLGVAHKLHDESSAEEICPEFSYRFAVSFYRFNVIAGPWGGEDGPASGACKVPARYEPLAGPGHHRYAKLNFLIDKRPRCIDELGRCADGRERRVAGDAERSRFLVLGSYYPWPDRDRTRCGRY